MVYCSPNPICISTYGLGSSYFARHYFRNHCLFSLPMGTKMFQFPTFPYHVLLRLLVPRHSPYALCSLTFIVNKFSMFNIASLSFPSFLVTFLLVYLEVFKLLSFSIYFSMCFLKIISFFIIFWWAQMESNHRPHAYQACALTIWAMSPYIRV